MSPCAVKWCVALASQAAGHCAVHEANEKLHPMPLAPNEELIDGAFGPCEDCEARFFDKATSTYYMKSDGQCGECNGTGECGDTCSHGHHCEHECEACDGTGECQTCHGSGYGGVRVREQAA